MVHWDPALESERVAYLAVARIRDGVILVERINRRTTESEKRAIENILTKLLEKSAYSKRSNREEQCRCATSFDGSVYASADPQGVFVAVVGVRDDDSDSYPSHIAWDMLNKFVSVVTDLGIDIEKARAADMVMLFKPMQNFMKSYNQFEQQCGASQVQEKNKMNKVAVSEKVAGWKLLKARVKETLQKNNWRTTNS